MDVRERETDREREREREVNRDVRERATERDVSLWTRATRVHSVVVRIR